MAALMAKVRWFRILLTEKGSLHCPQERDNEEGGCWGRGGGEQGEGRRRGTRGRQEEGRKEGVRLDNQVLCSVSAMA